MAALRARAVLFDFGGVLLLRPQASASLTRDDQPWQILRSFLQGFLTKGNPDGPFARAERGQITFSEFLSELDNEFKNNANAAAVSIPSDFSAREAFFEMYVNGKINAPLLQAAVTLRNHGFKTCILTNNWVDDTPTRDSSAQVLTMLREHFDFLIESCRIGMRKPEPRIYQYALDMLKVKPQEAIFLDDIGSNLKPAREMGMTTLLFRDPDAALKELQDLTGIQLVEAGDIRPTSCRPDELTHGYVPVKPGVQLHFVEKGNGPVLCLCHGFPESWYSWRYQIPALADAGFRVIALDMKGYGDSSAPLDTEEYSQEEICKDLVTFLNRLGISQATFIGHDWGGAVVWNMALFYPDRVRAVAGLNTPFLPSHPKVNVMERIKSNPIFDYQLYFQEPGVAESELEKNLSRTFKVMFRGSKKEDKLSSSFSTANVRERGGLLVGTPEDPSLSKMLGEEELQYYVQQFKKSGFRGPLNWYRNIDKNWKWGCTAMGRKIMVPALMVTAGKDTVLLPKMSSGMEDWIPQLTRGHIEDCGHWTQIERPAALNSILLTWLEQVHTMPATSSKL
ncbi:bifunctional epoxide hydrolase 2 [Ambystoma mexicanum]|uniref:bifunctional epoxide hydrolase 2 n=1 Tax=Ambystoma mexicanum TaxID=8296 RepID=UPI0037E92FCB